METKDRCMEQVREQGIWPRFHQCERKAVASHDGKGYCKQHHPDSVKARQEASMAHYRAKTDARLAPHRKLERLSQEHAEMKVLLNKFLADEGVQRALTGHSLRCFAANTGVLEENAVKCICNAFLLEETRLLLKRIEE